MEKIKKLFKQLRGTPEERRERRDKLKQVMKKTRDAGGKFAEYSHQVNRNMRDSPFFSESGTFSWEHKKEKREE